MNLKYLLLCALSVLTLTITHETLTRRPFEGKPCPWKSSCLGNPNCFCYCSEKGDFRKKTADDKPVWVENDKNKKYCYCKQWDLDKYPGPAER